MIEQLDGEDRPCPVAASRPDVRQCPGCWHAALKTDVHRFVHEIWPCYPGCHQTGEHDV
jgi:hypothetical protein